MCEESSGTDPLNVEIGVSKNVFTLKLDLCSRECFWICTPGIFREASRLNMLAASLSNPFYQYYFQQIH